MRRSKLRLYSSCVLRVLFLCALCVQASKSIIRRTQRSHERPIGNSALHCIAAHCNYRANSLVSWVSYQEAAMARGVGPRQPRWAKQGFKVSRTNAARASAAQPKPRPAKAKAASAKPKAKSAQG